MYTMGSLFTGIGGFDLGLERAGFEIKWQVEIDNFCQKVLSKHWPKVPKYGDIKNVGKHNLETVDLVCGGFPCQPFSVAGKRKGREDNRYLWPEMFRIIQELHPRWVIAENVPGIVSIGNSMVFEQVCIDLEGEGYEVQPLIIPACAVNAPHRRDRIWIIANANSERLQRSIEANNAKRQESDDKFPHGCNREWNEDWAEVATSLCRVDARVPNRVDRLRALGNAIVPQIAEIFGRFIIEIETGVRKHDKKRVD